MSAQPQIRVAFGSVPKDSGTFPFYRNLRPALLGYGIDLRCVSLEKNDAYLSEADYVDEGCHLLVPRSSSPKMQARAFTDWFEAKRIDIVWASSPPEFCRRCRIYHAVSGSCQAVPIPSTMATASRCQGANV